MGNYRTIESNRVYVCTAENGGLEKEGVILIRPGVEDVSIGDHIYAPARIIVASKYLLRGMALYSDGIPDGFDIMVFCRHTLWDLIIGNYDKCFSTIIPIKDINNPFDREVVDVSG